MLVTAISSRWVIWLTIVSRDPQRCTSGHQPSRRISVGPRSSMDSNRLAVHQARVEIERLLRPYMVTVGDWEYLCLDKWAKILVEPDGNQLVGVRDILQALKPDSRS